MFQRALTVGGGGSAKAFIQNFPNGIANNQEIDVGFEPSIVYLFIHNYSAGNDMYTIWEKDIHSGQVLQLYVSSISWYSLPNTAYAGINNISGTKITGNNLSGLNCDLYAFGE